MPSSDRIYNFSAGPAALPLPVLEQIRDEMICLPGAGASILEISHRSPTFAAILNDADTRLRRLLKVPDDYELIFLQGGSRLLFSMVPMNLAVDKRPTQHLITGSWSAKAFAEATKLSSATTLWDGKPEKYQRVPRPEEYQWTDDASYLHMCANETIQGVQFPAPPDCGQIPLVCDASSELLSRPMEVDRYGVIYACAQKNCGPAGVTLALIRKDLLDRSRSELPGYLNFANHVAEGSLYNTPSTFGIYVVGLVARWLEEEMGGLEAMEQRNREKAGLIYQAIDESQGFYLPHAETGSRSAMNVCFRFADESVQTHFLDRARDEGLGELKGHRSVGGIRASLYNAMPPAGARALAEFMADFARQHAAV